MHIPKYLVLAVVTVLCASSLHAQRADSDIQAKAREQLRQAMEQLDAGKPATATNTAVAMPKQEKPLAKPAVVTAPPAVAVTPAVSPSSKELSAAEEAKARESMRKAEQEMTAQRKAEDTAAAKAQKEMAAQQKAAAIAAAKAEASQAKMAPAVAPAKVMATPSVVAAPMAVTPASGSKDQRLLDLLQAYKADKITPTEYHAQRAKILAEP
jgi:hypothetical protein